MAGVTALIGVTAVLASKMGDATSETDELIQSTSELKDKASETSEALKQATQNMTSSMEEVNASGTLANNLTDELVKLAGQSNQTTEHAKSDENDCHGTEYHVSGNVTCD